MARFQVPDMTRSFLRGSSFKDEGLFGPLPESFQDSLRDPQGKDLMCKVKNKSSSYSRSYSSIKRPMSFQRSFPAKRPKLSAPQSSASPSTSFATPPSTSVPRQGFRSRRGRQKRTGSYS